MGIVIYGAGGNGRQFYKAIKQKGQQVDFFIDQYSDAKEYDGVPILRLADVTDKTVPVYVSVSCTSTIIANQLREMGFENVFDFNESVPVFPEIIDAFLSIVQWYSEDLSEMVDPAKIEALSQLFSDQKSHDVLKNIVDFRTHMTAETYQKNDTVTQYFPEDVDLFSHLKTGVRMVDCGAFIGDTLQQTVNYFEHQNHKIDYIALIEPDSKNLKPLQQNVKKYSHDIDLVVIPAGVWSDSQILEFDSNGSSSVVMDAGEVNANATEKVPVVSIDQVFYGMKPNYIKMDIEGAEVNAIKGAEQVIRDFSPVLAICLYHRGSDLWEIPLAIHAMNPNYQYYLRVHGDMGLETVIYCVPKS